MTRGRTPEGHPAFLLTCASPQVSLRAIVANPLHLGYERPAYCYYRAPYSNAGSVSDPRPLEIVS